MKNNSQDFYNERMRNLAKFGVSSKQNSESTQRTLVGEAVRSMDGTAYGVIKENHNYIIKKSTSQKENLCESDFTYINGVQNKTQYTYPSLADADKNRNMFVKTINEAYCPNSIKNEEPKEIISEGVVSEKIEDSVGFISTLLSKKKSEINESWGNKFKDTVKKHSIQGKQQIIGEDVVSTHRKMMNMLNEDVQNGEEQDGTDSEIDKAIDALNNLDNKTEETETQEPTTPVEQTPDETEANVEAPVPDETDLSTDNTSDVATDTEAIPDTEAVAGDEVASDEAPVPDETTTDSTDENPEDAELTKELEKLVGKIGYNARKANLTPDETSSFLKSILSSFEGDLAGLDPNQKKELTKKIMSSEEPEQDVQTESFDVDNEESEDNDECGECGSFEAYSKSMGYDSLDEASPIEKGYVISGYVDAYKNGKNDGDFATISKHLTPEVVNELAEYGHDDYAKEAEIYTSELPEDNEESETEEIEKELECEGCGSQVDEATNDIKDFNSLSDDEKSEAFQMYLQKKAGLTENKKQDMSFAKNETIGVVKPTSVNEEKLKSFIKNVLKECVSGKKSVINESAVKQSPNLAKVEAYVKAEYAKRTNKK